MGFVGGWESALDNYNRVIESLKSTGDFRYIIEALELIPLVVKEVMEEQGKVLDSIQEGVESLKKEVKIVKGKLEKYDGKLENLVSNYQNLADKAVDISEKMNEINKRLSRLEMYVGALTETFISEAFVENLLKEGYIIKNKLRNYSINEEEIDLVVIAEKEGKEKHFVVEIKVKPKHSDIGALLSKAEIYSSKAGVKAIPVIAGVWIGLEIKSYAESKNVIVWKI
ncbi:MAG: hypothetical protein GSR82_02970 [Desulfurococcales archaeon]|nr:hypothetical protein [Desulfurococcales archaeon]